jgi:hypothetical protein
VDIKPEEDYSKHGEYYPSNISSFEVGKVFIEDSYLCFSAKGYEKSYSKVPLVNIDKPFVYISIRGNFNDTKEYVYFSCKEALKDQLRGVGLLLLKREDQELKEYIKRNEVRKKRIRLAFFDHLNK